MKMEPDRIMLHGVLKEEGFHWINQGENCAWTVIELRKHWVDGWYIKRLDKDTISLEEAKDWKWGHRIRMYGETDEALVMALDEAEAKCSMYKMKYEDEKAHNDIAPLYNEKGKFLFSYIFNITENIILSRIK